MRVALLAYAQASDCAIARLVTDGEKSNAGNANHNTTGEAENKRATVRVADPDHSEDAK